MENETQENETLTNEPEATTPEPVEAEKPEEEKSKELQSALAQKDHFREKFERVEAEKKSLEEKLAKRSQGQSIDPMDTVKLAKAVADNTDEELEFIIRNAKDKSPQGIIEAKNDPWVKAAIESRREKVEKERQTLEPSTRQPEVEKEISFAEALKNASLEEKERLLTEKGLYKTYRRRDPANRINLSNGIGLR